MQTKAIGSVRATRRLTRAAVIGVCVAGLAGCSGVLGSPLVQPEVPRPGVKRDADDHPVLDADRQIQTVHVPVRAAEEYARFLQDAYRRAAGNRIQARRAFDFGLIWTALTALGFVALDDNTDVATVLGLTGAGLSFTSDRFLQATHARVYFQGAQALECVVAASTRYPYYNGDAQKLRLAGLAVDGELAALVIRRRAVEDAPGFATLAGADRSLVDEKLATADLLFRQGGLVSSTVHAAAGAVDPLGRILLSKIESIRLAVDAEIARLEPDPMRLDESLKSTLSIGPGLFSPDFAVPGVQKVAKKSSSAAALSGAARAFAGPIAKLEEAIQAADTATNAALRALSEVNGAVVTVYPPDLFTHCTLANAARAARLRLGDGAVAVQVGESTTIYRQIEGGRAPFTARTSALAAVGISAMIGARDSRQLIVRVTKDAPFKAGDTIDIGVSDADGDATFLTLSFEGGATAGDGGDRRGADRSGETPGYGQKPSEPLKAVQAYLISQGLDLGEKKDDGLFGPMTRTAIVACALADGNAAQFGSAVDPIKRVIDSGGTPTRTQDGALLAVGRTIQADELSCGRPAAAEDAPPVEPAGPTSAPNTAPDAAPRAPVPLLRDLAPAVAPPPGRSGLAPPVDPSVRVTAMPHHRQTAAVPVEGSRNPS